MQITGSCPGFPSNQLGHGEAASGFSPRGKPSQEGQAEISQAVLAEHVGFSLFTSFRALP